MDSYLVQYWNLIQSGEEVVGYYLRQQISNLIDDLDNPDYIYDTKEAHNRILFMETAALQSKDPYYGKPLKLMPWQKAFFEVIYSFKMADTGLRRFTEALLIVARKNGKALSLDTRIPTPLGDRTMGDIQVGDFVFDEQGRPVEVERISPIFTDHKCFKVVFEDGEEIVADADHNWLVRTKASRRAKRFIDTNGYYVATTQELFEKGVYDGKEYRFRVPMGAPVHHVEKELLIAPYTLGYWLGDGCKNTSFITCGKQDLEETVQHIREDGYLVEVSEAHDNYKLTVNKAVGRSILPSLHSLGIYEKHIPSCYLLGSVNQRRELLKGLMDSDGYVSKAGQCEWVQKSERLTKDFCELLTSLGIKFTLSEKRASCSGKDCGIAYRVNFYVDKETSCFKLARKHSRLKDKLHSRMEAKSIISIEEVETVPTKCISVGGNHLYLCGERNTVTHNSSMMAGDALYDLFIGSGGKDICCASNDDRQAKILWSEIASMRTRLDPKKTISSQNLTEIRNDRKNTKVSRLSTKIPNKDGFNFSKVYLDEIHDIREENAQSEIYEACWRAMSSREDPLLICMSTNGFNRDCFCDKKIQTAKDIIDGKIDNVHFLSFLFLQDSENEIWEDENSWAKSNPSIKYGVKKIHKLRQDIEVARTDVGSRIHMLCKDFNVTTSSAKGWLNLEDYNYEQQPWSLEDFRGAVCLAAADLSMTTDLTNIKLMFMRPGEDKTKYIYSHYWIPEIKLVKSDDSGSGADYKKWIKEGYISVCEGTDNNLIEVADWILDLKKKYGIAALRVFYDQRYAQEFKTRLDDAGVETEVIQQSKYVLSTPTKLLENELKSHNINYNNNPVDKWCYSNAALEVDSAGRRQIVKMRGTHDRRIDGAVTSAILFAGYQRCKEEFSCYVR